MFEHLAMVERVAERDVEQALMDRLQDTMLELGRGMAFVGRQVRLTVPDDASDRVDEFYVDLLFFHVEQLRYVVVELKIGQFEPAHAGQLGTYVAIFDDQFRRPEIHAPTIGILLCTGKTGPTVRYALAGTRVPIAVADYQGLPEEALVRPAVRRRAGGRDRGRARPPGRGMRNPLSASKNAAPFTSRTSHPPSVRRRDSPRSSHPTSRSSSRSPRRVGPGS